MDLLTFGLIFFFVVHCIPFFPKLRNSLAGKLGEKAWKGLFSLASLAGLVLIGFGYSKAPYEPLLSVSPGAVYFAYPVMFPAFILIIAGNLKGHIRKMVRHPMMLGFFIWGISHLLATGDLANVKMFGAFAVYAVVSVISAELRGRVSAFTPKYKEDVKAILSGVILYAILFFAHGWLFGAPLI